MKILAIVAGCIFSVRLLSAECVEVTPPVHRSSESVRITAVFNGKPLRDAKLEFFFASEQKSRLTLSTDLKGIASAPHLEPGFYRVVATGPDGQSADLYLEVRKASPISATSFEMSLVPSVSPLEARLAIAKKTPITQSVHEFKGVLLDPSGAAIPGAEIEIIRKGTAVGSAAKLKADEAGHFNASLDEGAYVAFIQAPGFRTEIVAFELTQEATSKALRISMRIGAC